MNKSMNIKLKHRYKGPLTDGLAMLPGEYNGDDLPPELAEYLVENDHAIEIGSNTSRVIDVVKSASPVVKQAIATMLSDQLSQLVDPEAPKPVESALTPEEQSELKEGIAAHLSVTDMAQLEVISGEATLETPEESKEDKPKRGKRGKQ